MSRTLILAAYLALGMTTHLAAQRNMDNQVVIEVLSAQGLEWEGENGSWLVHYRDRVLLLLTDESNNRMRIFTPIAREEELSTKEMQRMLTANFHSALDAKYSLYEGFAVSVFTHPLRELSRAQLIDALQQVNKLAETFGTTYSSTDLIFSPATPSEKEEEEEKPAGEKRS